KGACNPRVAPRAADAARVGDSIDVAVARTCAAILPFAQAGEDAPGQLTGAIGRQVCRLEWVQQEAGGGSLPGRNTDHAAISSVVDHPPRSLAPAAPPTTYAAFEPQPRVVIQGPAANLVQQVHPRRTGWVLRSKIAISSSMLPLPEVFHE